MGNNRSYRNGIRSCILTYEGGLILSEAEAEAEADSILVLDIAI